MWTYLKVSNNTHLFRSICRWMVTPLANGKESSQDARDLFVVSLNFYPVLPRIQSSTLQLPQILSQYRYLYLARLMKDTSKDLRVLTVKVTKINDYDFYNWQGEGTFLVVTVDWTRRGNSASFPISFLIRIWFILLTSTTNSTPILILALINLSLLFRYLSRSRGMQKYVE